MLALMIVWCSKTSILSYIKHISLPSTSHIQVVEEHHRSHRSEQQIVATKGAEGLCSAHCSGQSESSTAEGEITAR